MKVPQKRFRIPEFYGDNNWHVINDANYPISLNNPYWITIDSQITELPSYYGNIEAIRTGYLWRYGFASLSNSSMYWYNESGSYNYSSMYYRYHYGSSTGSNGSTDITALDVGISYTNRWYYIGAGNIVEECYYVSNSGTKAAPTYVRFGDYTSWYMGRLSGYPSEAATSAETRGIIVKFKKPYETDLPADMYTISNHVITWNTAHPIYKLLYGTKVRLVPSSQG